MRHWLGCHPRSLDITSPSRISAAFTKLLHRLGPFHRCRKFPLFVEKLVTVAPNKGPAREKPIVVLEDGMYHGYAVVIFTFTRRLPASVNIKLAVVSRGPVGMKLQQIRMISKVSSMADIHQFDEVGPINLASSRV